MAFGWCSGLTSIDIPNSVSVLGGLAFYKCSNLKSVTIPNSVKIIEDRAFEGCENLKEVYSFITDVFEIPQKVFDKCPEVTLFVPYGTSGIYKSTSGWNSISNIVEMQPSIPILISCNTKGSVSVNGSPSISSKISAADINQDTDNTFTFTPKSGCKLDQVILNGLDITANVEGNTLTCTIPANSQMIVTFATEQGDMNNDGTLDISDIVSIVNKILGN